MTQTQILNQIQFRGHRSICVQLEKRFGCGERPVSPEIEKVYREHREAAAALEKQLGKGKGTGA